MGQLVLSRKDGEQIEIGEGPRKITLTVLGARGKGVRIGIEAPRDMRVKRGELPPLDPPPRRAA